MKLINNDIYLLLIDEEVEIKGTVCLCYNSIKNTWNEDIILYQGTMPDYHYTGFQKIIAYRKLTKEAKELEGLPKWPNPFEEVDIEELALKAYFIDSMETLDLPPFENVKNYIEEFIEGFIAGYKAAQQSNKQFSLEDIKKAIRFAYNAGRRVEMNAVPPDFKFETYREELIQSLSTQQLPKEFVISDKFSTFEENLKNGEYKWWNLETGI